MAEFEATITSARGRVDTFRYMADFRSVAEWDPSVEGAALTSGAPGETGATYEVTFSTGRGTMTLPYVAKEVASPDRIVLRAETDSMISLDTITVSEDSGRVQVHYHAKIELKGVRKLATPFAGIALSRAGKKAAAGLTEKLSWQPQEKGPAAAEPPRQP